MAKSTEADKATPTIIPRAEPQLTDGDIKALIRHAMKNGDRRASFFGLGFGVRPNSDGTATFLFKFRSPVTRKQRWYTIGVYSELETGMSLADAKKERNRAQIAVDDGRDPIDEATKAKAAKQSAQQVQRGDTLRDVFDHWKRIELKLVMNKNGTRQSGYSDNGKHIEGQFKTHVLPRFGDMPIREVTKAEVLEHFKDGISIRDGKRSTAGHVLRDLKTMFNFALDREYIERDPIHNIDIVAKLGKANTGTKFLEDWEITRFMRRLPIVGLHVVTQLALRFILANGSRPAEVTDMPKSELNGDGTEWIIPDYRYKLRRDHVIPLSPHAQRILQEAARFNVGSPWVFPSPIDLKEHIDRHSLSKAVARKLGKPRPKDGHPEDGKLGMAKFNPNDLRRSVETGLNRLGVDESIATRVLGHTTGNAGRMSTVYNRHDYLKEKREALDLWGKHLDSLA